MAKFAGITFKDKKMRAFLSDLAKRDKQVKNKDKTLAKLISTKVFEDINDHFEKQQDPRGKWQKWSDSYTKFMNKIGRGNNKILQFSGRLRNTFKPSNYRTNSQGIIWYNNATTKDGYPYAYAHDTGDGPLPMREFMWLSDKGGKRIEQVVLGYLRDGKK